MGVKSRGRGIAATFGVLLVVAGIVGAVVLWVMAEGRPEQAVERFARGPVGCTTTLEFGEAGTFFVYEERVEPGSDAFAACEPATTPEAAFRFELLDDGQPLAVREDTSIEYDVAGATGRSLARAEIPAPGRYELVVEGSDASVVAAVGRDPDQGVSDLRRGAIVVGVLGVLLGILLLVLAGRRSRRATTGGAPAPPSATSARPLPPSAEPAPEWPPAPPRVPDIAVPVPTEAPPARSPWAPPRADARRDPPPAP